MTLFAESKLFDVQYNITSYPTHNLSITESVNR